MTDSCLALSGNEKPAAPLPAMSPLARPAPVAVIDEALGTATASGKNRPLFIGGGLILRGELSGCDHLVIDGHVEADVTSCGTIEIRETGTFKGSVNAAEAKIAGKYEGSLAVENTLFVGPSAKVRGAVQCGRLQLEPGGKIDGELTTLRPAPEPKPSETVVVVALHAQLRQVEPVAAPTIEPAAFLPVELSAQPKAEPPVKQIDAAMAAAIDSCIHRAIEELEPPREVIDPDALEKMFTAATTVVDRAALDEAETTFKAALDANPLDIAALSGLGHLARQRGDFAAALDFFEAVIALDAGNSSVRHVVANILRKLARPKEAEAMSRSALAAEPQNESERADTAATLETASAFDEAEAMFKAVLARKPNHVAATAGLARLARRRGDRDDSVRIYKAALAPRLMDVSLRVELAVALREQGQLYDAQQILETVLQEQHRIQSTAQSQLAKA